MKSESATGTSSIEVHGTDIRTELSKEELEFLLARCRSQLDVERIPVMALIDSGSLSTIISRSLLHQIAVQHHATQ